MRIRFISGIAAPAWSYDPGQVADMPDADAKSYIKMGIAVEAAPRACPHCGGALNEPSTAPGPEAAPEAAALVIPRRRG